MVEQDSRRAANVLNQVMQPCGAAPLELENACDQTDLGSVVDRVATAEVVCHTGGRGFDSRRSRFKIRLSTRFLQQFVRPSGDRPLLRSGQVWAETAPLWRRNPRRGAA